MEAKFTPGPWFTSRPHGTIYIEARLRGTTLQEVASVGPTETANQQEANARLIAAAPELLEALSKMVDRITYYAELKSGEIPNIEDWAYTYNSGDMIAARAAIAKATGEQA